MNSMLETGYSRAAKNAKSGFASRCLLAGVALMLILGFAAPPASACPNLIDCTPTHAHKGGVWSIAKTGLFPGVLIGVTGAAALWEGDHNRFGNTLWQSIDAAAISGIITQAMKFSFQRARPHEVPGNANDWFSGIHHRSFPSGDVSAITALVTPPILEYGPSHPWVYALALLPAYDGAARVEYRDHYPTDVIAGMLVGFASGWLAHHYREHHIIVSILPKGLLVGFKHDF